MGQQLVFVDLETGGIDPRRHPIIQIAAIATDELLSPVEAFEAKIAFDTKTANRHSLRKNHYHPGIWSAEAAEPQVVALEFATFLRRHSSVMKLSAKGEPFKVAQLVAHNASFDAGFLVSFYQRYDRFLPANGNWLCTMQRAMWHFAERRDFNRPKDMKLSTLCQHFRVAFHAAAAHEALADVTATVGLYRALLNASNSSTTSAVYSPTSSSEISDSGNLSKCQTPTWQGESYGKQLT